MECENLLPQIHKNVKPIKKDIWNLWSESNVWQEVRIIVRFHVCIVIVQFVIDEILQSNKYYWIDKMNCWFRRFVSINLYYYRFGGDEHIPWCQRSDAVQHQNEKNHIKSIAWWTDFHFYSVHGHVCVISKIYFNVNMMNWEIQYLNLIQNRCIPLKFSSSLGKLFASHAGVRRTGFAKNGALSTSVLPLPSTEVQI